MLALLSFRPDFSTCKKNKSSSKFILTFTKTSSKNMSISQKSCPIPKGLFRVLPQSLGDGGILATWWTALPESQGMWEGKIPRGWAFYQKKGGGDWVVEGRCLPGSAISSTLNLNHLQGPWELISVPWLGGKTAPSLPSKLLWCFSSLSGIQTSAPYEFHLYGWISSAQQLVMVCIAITNHHVNM